MKSAEIFIFTLLTFGYMSWPCSAVVDQGPYQVKEHKKTVDLKPFSATRSWTRYAKKVAYLERSFKCCLMGRTAAKIGYFCDFGLQVRSLRVNERHFHRVKTEVWRRTPRLITHRVFRQCRKHKHSYQKCCEDESQYMDRFIEQKRRELKLSRYTEVHPTDPPLPSTVTTDQELIIRIHPNERRVR